jgi:hypothetical protein
MRAPVFVPLPLWAEISRRGRCKPQEHADDAASHAADDIASHHAKHDRQRPERLPRAGGNARRPAEIAAPPPLRGAETPPAAERKPGHKAIGAARSNREASTLSSKPSRGNRLTLQGNLGHLHRSDPARAVVVHFRSHHELCRLNRTQPTDPWPLPVRCVIKARPAAPVR